VLAIAGGLDVSGVRLLDAGTGELITEVPAAPEAFVSIRPDREEFVATPEYGVVQRYRFDGTPVGAPLETEVDADLVHTPDGGLLMAATLDSGQFYDAETLEPVGRPFTTTGSRFFDGTFSPDGEVLVMSADDGSLVVVDAGDGSVRNRVNGIAEPCSLEFRDDRRVLCLPPAGRAAEFDLGALAPIGATASVEAPVGHFALLPDGRLLAGAGTDVLEVDDAGRLQPTAMVDLPAVAISLAASPDGELVGVLGYVESDASLVALVLEPTSGEVLANVPVLEVDNGGGGRLAFSPAADRLAVGTGDGTVTVLDPRSGRVLAREQVDSSDVRGLSWPSERELLQSGQDGVFRVLDPENLTVVRELPLSEQVNVTDVQPVPGSGLVLTTSEDGFVRWIDPSVPEAVGEPLSADGTQLQAVAPSPDGRWIAAVSRDGTLRLWDRSSGRAVGPPLSAHEVQSVAIAWLDDDTVVTASLGGTVIVSDVRPDAWVDRACELAGRDLTRAEWQRYLPDQPYRATCTT
jgi:WD40 repeat protein